MGSLPANLGTTVRLSSFYAAYFVVVGILLPFWPVWLSSKGLGAAEIGGVLAAGTFIKVIVNPAVAHIADRRGERKRLMVLLAFGALLCFSLFSLSSGFWMILLVTVLFFGFWSAIMPLAESLTMLSAQNEGVDYGRVRLWGSLSFIAAAIAAGSILTGRPEHILFLLSLGAVAVAVVVCLLLPATTVSKEGSARFPILEVLRNRAFIVLLAACMLIQSSHAVYYGFATLHWRAAGFSDTVIGLLWAEGVVAEIILFMFGAALVNRFGPVWLVLFGCLAGVVRWSMLALSTDLGVLATFQVLHAFSYGAAHLGAIHFMARTIPPALSATAQSVYGAAVMGIGMGLTILAAGRLYGEYAGGAFWVMAAMGGAGVILTLYLLALHKRTAGPA